MKLKRKTKRSGMSLIEVVIVLAISALLITIAFATFGQRRGVAVDDEVNQIIAQIEKVRNDAQKGSGPDPNDPSFLKDETIFGEAIEFDNKCTSLNQTPCMHVYKLKQLAGNSIHSYDTQDVPLTEALTFQMSNGNCNNQFLLCFQPDGSGSFGSPPNACVGSGENPMIVTRNATGEMYLAGTGQNKGFNPSRAGNANYYSTAPNPCQGVLKLPVYQNNGKPAAQADYKYYINVDMTGNNEITSTRQ